MHMYTQNCVHGALLGLDGFILNHDAGLAGRVFMVLRVQMPRHGTQVSELGNFSCARSDIYSELSTESMRHTYAGNEVFQLSVYSCPLRPIRIRDGI